MSASVPADDGVVVPLGKREQTKQLNRRLILDAAREAFGELGFEAVSVRDIIRRTPLSVGAFYNYFRSKEEVSQALADDGAERFQPILREQRRNARDLESYVRASVHAYFTFLAAEHRTWEGRRPAGEAGFHHARYDTPELRAVFAEVRDSFAEAMARGEAPPADPDYLAAGCIALVREIGDEMLKRRPLDVEGASAFCVRFILGGVPALPRRTEAST